MKVSETRAPWWKVTPQGLIVLGGLIALSTVVCLPIIWHNQAIVTADQAAIEEMVRETNAFAESIRCIREETWRLTSAEAEHAEIQMALALEGLPAAWVDPAVLKRLEAAKRCP